MSFELCRLHIDLIMCYIIVFGLVDLEFDNFVKVSPSNVTRGHNYKLFRQRGGVTGRNNFLSYRIVSLWSYLPPDAVDFSSLATFRRTIQLVDFSEFLLGSV